MKQQRAPAPAHAATSQSNASPALAVVQRMVQAVHPGVSSTTWGEGRKPGDFGALDSDQDMFLRAGFDLGADATHTAPLKAGEACEVLESGPFGQIKVRVRDGDDHHQGWISRHHFSEQPRLADDGASWDDLEYNKFPIEPLGEIAAKDLEQGILGDCYFITAAAALAQANPNLFATGMHADVENQLFWARFYSEDATGKRFPEWVSVDGLLPTHDEYQGLPFYGSGAEYSAWPALLEKAYAKWKGGYHTLDEGGFTGDALEELSGLPSTEIRNSLSKHPAHVGLLLQAYHREGRALAVGSRGMQPNIADPGFTAGPDGTLVGTVPGWGLDARGLQLRRADGTPLDVFAEDIPSRDEGTAQSVYGCDIIDGQIDENGLISIRFVDGSAPQDLAALRTAFTVDGWVSSDRDVMNNHAFRVRAIDPSGNTALDNPWGVRDPAPFDIDKLQERFNVVYATPPFTAREVETATGRDPYKGKPQAQKPQPRKP